MDTYVGHLICVFCWILVVWVHAWSWASVDWLGLVGRAGLRWFWSRSCLDVAWVASHVFVHAMETALADGRGRGRISLRATVLYHSCSRRVQYLVCDIFEGPIDRETPALNSLLCWILVYDLWLWHLSLAACASPYLFWMLTLSDLLLIFELHHIYARVRHAQMARAHANFWVAHFQTLSAVGDIGWVDVLILLLSYLRAAPVAWAPAPYSFEHLLLLSDAWAYIADHIADGAAPRSCWRRWDARHGAVGSLLPVLRAYGFALGHCRPSFIITSLGVLARALMRQKAIL